MVGTTLRSLCNPSWCTSLACIIHRSQVSTGLTRQLEHPRNNSLIFHSMTLSQSIGKPEARYAMHVLPLAQMKQDVHVPSHIGRFPNPADDIPIGTRVQYVACKPPPSSQTFKNYSRHPRDKNQWASNANAGPQSMENDSNANNRHQLAENDTSTYKRLDRFRHIDP